MIFLLEREAYDRAPLTKTKTENEVIKLRDYQENKDKIIQE